MTEIQMKPRGSIPGDIRRDSFLKSRGDDFKLSLQTGHVTKLRELTDRMFPSSRMFSPEVITRAVSSKKKHDSGHGLGYMGGEGVSTESDNPRTSEMAKSRKRKRGSSEFDSSRRSGTERMAEYEDGGPRKNRKYSSVGSHSPPRETGNFRPDLFLPERNVKNKLGTTTSFPLTPEEDQDSRRKSFTFDPQSKVLSPPISLSDSFSTLAKTNYILQDLQMKYNEMLHRISSTIEFSRPPNPPISPRSPIQQSFSGRLLNPKFLPSNLNFSPKCIFPNPLSTNLFPQFPLRLNLPIFHPYGPNQTHDVPRMGGNGSQGMDFLPFPFPKLGKQPQGNVLPIIPYVNDVKFFPNVNNVFRDKNTLNEKDRKSEKQERAKCVDDSLTACIIGKKREILPGSDECKAAKEKKSHRCIYCGKLYSRKYGLKIHIRTHTGYKPLKCKVCGRPFGDPSNLNKHVRLHAEGDTPYRCEFCGKVLVRRRDLERHIKSRHPSHERTQSEKLFDVDGIIPSVY